MHDAKCKQITTYHSFKPEQRKPSHERGNYFEISSKNLLKEMHVFIYFMKTGVGVMK